MQEHKTLNNYYSKNDRTIQMRVCEMFLIFRSQYEAGKIILI